MKYKYFTKVLESSIAGLKRWMGKYNAQSDLLLHDIYLLIQGGHIELHLVPKELFLLPLCLEGLYMYYC